MIKHIILWTLSDKLGCDEKAKIISDAKAALESLNGKIDGLISLELITEKLDSSSADMMLDSSFTDEASLISYQQDPLHRSAADAFVRPFVDKRLCMDYEI